VGKVIGFEKHAFPRSLTVPPAAGEGDLPRSFQAILVGANLVPGPRTHSSHFAGVAHWAQHQHRLRLGRSVTRPPHRLDHWRQRHPDDGRNQREEGESLYPAFGGVRRVASALPPVESNDSRVACVLKGRWICRLRNKHLPGGGEEAPLGLVAATGIGSSSSRSCGPIIVVCLRSRIGFLAGLIARRMSSRRPISRRSARFRASPQKAEARKRGS
jgi:hypothetical protein